MIERENTIHPEMRVRVAKELRALADRLDAGESPAILIAYDQTAGTVQHLLVGSDTDRHFRMMSRLQFVANYVEMWQSVESGTMREAVIFQDAVGVTQSSQDGEKP